MENVQLDLANGILTFDFGFKIKSFKLGGDEHYSLACLTDSELHAKLKNENPEAKTTQILR